MADDEPDRVEGVDFTDIGPVLDRISYPITAEDVVADHGDRVVERTNAEPITVRELFDPLGEDAYASPEELRQTIMTLMPKESVGRQRYSDRGLSTDVPGADRRQDRPLPGHGRGGDGDDRR